MSFFATPTVNDYKENVFKLTDSGLITVAILIAVLVIIAIVLRPKITGKAKSMATTQLVFSAVAMALAIVTAEIKFTRLPMGGSITLFSMLFIVLIGYWYGPKAGLLTGFAYGLLQFLTDPVFYSPLQLIIDYPLAFGALGLSGFFAEKKNGLIKGYILGVIGRYVFAFISGVVFFGHYAPEGTPATIYSLTYNATYILPEALATIAVISIPAVSKAMSYVRSKAAYLEFNATKHMP
ncbi:MAG: energy-coupled thiamine transporter ThiT [Catonella sp.]|uniref:energy-coupled thiamine transporter ThiT n=1 Tax=Catonella sp. TaxID=2382125 RepID=UPI003F9EF54E